MSKRDFAREFADRIVENLENGTAPWVRPWKPGEFSLPFNPVSGTVYKGINTVMLSSEGHEDPRFMTLLQANSQGWKVRKGSKSRPVIYWQFSREEKVRDEDGNPVRDESGKEKTLSVPLGRPFVRFSSVFHASQVDGIPEWNAREVTWNPDERTETILANSGASITHSQRDRAFYSILRDEIHLPPKANFDRADMYYATALHELGHWTGHPSRLDRTFGPHGSEDYAKEELRAEIGSWMTGMELGLGHDPDQHLGYVKSWVKILKEEPYEIFRACRDAEKIKEYTLALKRKRRFKRRQPCPMSGAWSRCRHRLQICNSFSPGTNLASKAGRAEYRPGQDLARCAVFQKGTAKKAGARWDRKEKSWFAPKGTDMTRLAAWLPGEKTAIQPETSLSPVQEFAQALREAGLDLQGEPPVMDGQLRRVPLLGRPAQDKDGAYQGYLDGRPAGSSRTSAPASR